MHASLTGIGNHDYNISAIIKNKSEFRVIGLRLSITARDCPTQDAPATDCDIFGRVETFESDIPAGKVRKINRKITIRGVAKPRYAVWPKVAVNGVRASLSQSDDAPANDLLSEWLGGASNNALRETQGSVFSNLRAGPFDNAQHRQVRFIATNLANALRDRPWPAAV